MTNNIAPSDFAGFSRDIGYGIAVDTSGNAYATGYTASSTPTPWMSGGWRTTFGGSIDGYVVKLNPAGTHLWSQAFGTLGTNQGNAIAVDGTGNVVVTGLFAGADFGTGPLTSVGGYADVFLFKRAP